MMKAVFAPVVSYCVYDKAKINWAAHAWQHSIHVGLIQLFISLYQIAPWKSIYQWLDKYWKGLIFNTIKARNSVLFINAMNALTSQCISSVIAQLSKECSWLKVIHFNLLLWHIRIWGGSIWSLTLTYDKQRSVRPGRNVTSVTKKIAKCL